MTFTKVEDELDRLYQNLYGRFPKVLRADICNGEIKIAMQDIIS